MKIRCAHCHDELKQDDIVVLDSANSLTHYSCFNLNLELSEDIGKFVDVQTRHWFLQDDAVLLN